MSLYHTADEEIKQLKKDYEERIKELETLLKEANRLRQYWLKRATRWDSKRVKELEAKILRVQLYSQKQVEELEADVLRHKENYQYYFLKTKELEKKLPTKAEAELIKARVFNDKISQAIVVSWPMKKYRKLLEELLKKIAFCCDSEVRSSSSPKRLAKKTEDKTMPYSKRIKRLIG